MIKIRCVFFFKVLFFTGWLVKAAFHHFHMFQLYYSITKLSALEQVCWISTGLQGSQEAASVYFLLCLQERFTRIKNSKHCSTWMPQPRWQKWLSLAGPQSLSSPLNIRWLQLTVWFHSMCWALHEPGLASLFLLLSWWRKVTVSA